MQPTIRAGILTIGTEVSSGQITNRNAAWLGNQLIDLCMEPAWHLTVADIPDDMRAALDFLEGKAQLLIVTGGLGPTTDDITRQIVAAWADDPLVFAADAWEHIQQRFQSLGVTAPESNRQQCYFPSQATILHNRRGTAHAFRIQKAERTLYCLPGPPEEIKAIWDDHIRAELQALGADSESIRLLRWQCIGLGESAVGELVEAHIAGSSLISGYRAHLPFVEVKLWCKNSHLAQEQPVLDRLDAALSRWTVARDDEDCLDRLLTIFAAFPSVLIDDFASFGALADRIGKKALPHGKLEVRTHFQKLEGKGPAPESELALHLAIDPVDDEGRWTLHWRTATQHRTQDLQLPFKRHKNRFDRERLFVCELSIASWSRAFPVGERLA